MSNLWLNARFGSRHLQIVRLGSWLSEIQMRRSPITFGANGYHAPGGPARAEKGWRWFQLYQLGGLI